MTDPIPMSMMSMMSVMSMVFVSLRVMSTNSIMILVIHERTPPVPRVIIPITMIITILLPVVKEFLELASSDISNGYTGLLALTRVNVSVAVLSADWVVIASASHSKTVSDQKENLDFHL